MRVLVFGDSIAQGFWDIEGGWVSRLRKAYDKISIATDEYNEPNIFNLGVSGDSSFDVLARLNNEAKARAKEEIAFVFAIGVNDARTKAGANYSSSEQYRQNLTEIVQQAQRYTDKLLFVGLTPCVEARSNPVSWGNTGYTNDRINEFDSELKNFCTENQLPFVEIFELFTEANNKAELLPDGLHPNEAGHQLITDCVKPALDSLLNLS